MNYFGAELNHYEVQSTGFRQGLTIQRSRSIVRL